MRVEVGSIGSKNEEKDCWSGERLRRSVVMGVWAGAVKKSKWFLT